MIGKTTSWLLSNSGRFYYIRTSGTVKGWYCHRGRKWSYKWICRWHFFFDYLLHSNTKSTSSSFRRSTSRRLRCFFYDSFGSPKSTKEINLEWKNRLNKLHEMLKNFLETLPDLLWFMMILKYFREKHGGMEFLRILVKICLEKKLKVKMYLKLKQIII